VGTDGKITVKSFTADGTSSSALTQARKAFEGKAEKMSFAAESSPTLVKVTFRLACR
jgi:hypothetical protein